MITATCANDKCGQIGTAYRFRGHPARIECGICHADCDLTDPTDDPPLPDEVPA